MNEETKQALKDQLRKNISFHLDQKRKMPILSDEALREGLLSSIMITLRIMGVC